ncbi:MAG: apolipoprotein N-acyltransferase [Desulfobacteraceae bacterium]
MTIAKQLTRYFPAVLSGFLLTAAFPGINFYPAAFFALVPLLVSAGSAVRKERLILGLIAGFCHFSTLLYWIVPTLEVYGGLHLVLSGSILTLLCIYLSLYFGLFTLLLGGFTFKSMVMPLKAAFLWTALEYARSFLFTGFPWGSTGYTQYKNLGFIQIADITGVAGVTFAVVLLNGFLALAFLGIIRSDPPFRNRVKSIFIPFAYTLIILLLILQYGRLRMNTVDSAVQNSEKTSISVIQGNIRQNLKWDKSYMEKSLETYTRLSEKAAMDNPDLIVWPETALPFYYDNNAALSAKLDLCIRNADSPFLIGGPAFRPLSDGKEFFNRAYMFNRFAIVQGFYDKNHLVPFGEYVPLGKYLKFVDKITAQSGDFSPGKNEFTPLPFSESSTGVLICFEIIFPSISGRFVENGADLLVTITNDAWFGRTSAPLQHFSMSVFRAVENRRSVARAANTGISGFVSPSGRIIRASGLFQEDHLTEKLPLPDLKTFYTSRGDLFAQFCTVAILMLFVVQGALKLKRKKSVVSKQ